MSIFINLSKEKKKLLKIKQYSDSNGVVMDILSWFINENGIYIRSLSANEVPYRMVDTELNYFLMQLEMNVIAIISYGNDDSDFFDTRGNRAKLS